MGISLRRPINFNGITTRPKIKKYKVFLIFINTNISNTVKYNTRSLNRFGEGILHFSSAMDTSWAQQTYPLSADELRNSLRVSLSPSEDTFMECSVHTSTMSTDADLPTQASGMSSKLDHWVSSNYRKWVQSSSKCNRYRAAGLGIWLLG